MKYRDVFELERAINQGIESKSWKLLKRIAKISGAIKQVADPIREQLQPTDAIKEFQSAAKRIRVENTGLSEDEIQAKLKEMAAEHPKAQKDANEMEQLEKEILADTIELELDPIPEYLVHNKDELVISNNLYMVLSRLDLIDDSVVDIKKKKKKK